MRKRIGRTKRVSEGQFAAIRRRAGQASAKIDRLRPSAWGIKSLPYKAPREQG